jgi:F-type H+-transporting ATPase subunit alpha
VSLYAVNSGYLDSIELAKVIAFESALHNYMRGSHAELMQRINATGDYNDEIESALKKALEDFKTNHTW